MADGTAVSNVSFTTTTDSLTLTCVPSLRFEGRKREDGTDLAELASLASEASYLAASTSSKLIVTDYRAAAADSWAVYAQFDPAQASAVISIANEDGTQLKVSQAATKIISRSQAGIAQTKASLAASSLKINRKQVRSTKNSSQGMVTWTLADTAGSQG